VRLSFVLCGLLLANAFVFNSGREGGYHFQFSAPSLSSKIVVTDGTKWRPARSFLVVARP